MPELNASIRDIPIPRRLQKMPISERGYPVPWFVCWLDENKQRTEPGTGKPDFRVVDTPKVSTAIKKRLCWLCGEPLGTFMCFVIGPMCCINRVSSEPPAHTDCAEYAVKACPFLANPRMRRHYDDLPEDHVEPGGIMVQHNPGATAMWVTRSYKLVRVGGRNGRDDVLIQIGEPERVMFYANGVPATRAEVMAAIEKGLPQLQKVAKLNGGHAELELQHQIGRAMRYLPEEASA